MVVDPFFLMGCIAVLIENRYISANETKTDQVKISFASQFVEMCRWDYCVYTESYRALLSIAKWLLVGPWSHAWGRSVFLLNVVRHAGFRSGSCGIGSLFQVEGICALKRGGRLNRAAAPFRGSPQASLPIKAFLPAEAYRPISLHTFHTPGGALPPWAGNLLPRNPCRDFAVFYFKILY